MGFITTAYFRVFQPLVAFKRETQAATTQAIRAARIRMFPEWYLTLSYVSALAASALVGVAGVVLLVGWSQAPVWLIAAFALAAAVTTFTLARLGFLLYPRLVATSRAQRIDAEFSSVAMLAYALAKGGMPMLDVFRAVAQERETFGEISFEFDLIVRETDWFGVDVNTALAQVAKTTPSKTLSGFLEGLVTIMNAGADPRDYLKRQAEAQLENAEVRMQNELDQAGLLAEVYVSGLLVLPLLLIVILSVLSALNSGMNGFIPLIVFVFIPLGTALYLLVVEMLLPPDPLAVPASPEPPLADFGIDGVRPKDLILPPPRPRRLKEIVDDIDARAGNSGDARSLRRRLVFERLRRQAARWWSRFFSRAIAKPLDAIEVSGTVAVIVFLLGAMLVATRVEESTTFILAGTSLLMASALVAAAPVGAFHEIRLRHEQRVCAALPEMLGKLTGFNERGIGLLKSFHILGRTTSGPLAKQMRAFDADLSWNGNLLHALRRMRERVDTVAMLKLGVLFSRASAATGDLKEALTVATKDATRMQNVRSRKRQAMMTYVVVIYLVYAVFLYVVYMITDLFYSGGGFALAAGAGTAVATAADFEHARLLFFHAVVIQGVCCGLVAGKLGEGHLLSGIKHAAVLGGIAWIVFSLGVF